MYGYESRRITCDTFDDILGVFSLGVPWRTVYDFRTVSKNLNRAAKLEFVYNASKTKIKVHHPSGNAAVVFTNIITVE